MHAAPSGPTRASAAQELWCPEPPLGFDVLPRLHRVRACRYRPRPHLVSVLLPFVPPRGHSLPRRRLSSRVGNRGSPERHAAPTRGRQLSECEGFSRSFPRGSVTRTVGP